MIGVYNGERYLAEAIDSVLCQTYRPLELIVVDDGSIDRTSEVARSYEPQLRYEFQPRRGLGAARNRAIELAQGAYFAFLDADDRFTRTKLQSQMACFHDDPELDIVFGHTTEFISPDIDNEATRLLRRPVKKAAWRTPNLMLAKRDAFFRVGLFSTTLKVGIGLEWYTRMTDQGLKIAVPPAVVLERRLHAGNNGIRERAFRPQYLHVLKAAIDRRREIAPTEPEI